MKSFKKFLEEKNQEAVDNCPKTLMPVQPNEKYTKMLERLKKRRPDLVEKGFFNND